MKRPTTTPTKSPAERLEFQLFAELADPRARQSRIARLYGKLMLLDVSTDWSTITDKIIARWDDEILCHIEQLAVAYKRHIEKYGAK